MLEHDGEGGNFGPSEEGSSGGMTGMQRAWYAHMAGLRASYNRHFADNPALKDLRIEQLLDPVASDHKGNATNWALPNEIEILLVRLKTGPDLDVSLDSSFATAESIGVHSVAAMAKRREAAVTDFEKQAILAKLLRDTHNRYAARRSERAARRIVALRMARLGFGLTISVVASIIVLGMGPKLNLFGSELEIGNHLFSRYNMAVAVFFGFLGAYLSRLIAFQNSAATLSFDDLENGYAPHFLFVRLLVGGLSALVVYFIIAGQLIGGELFPSPALGENGGFGQLWSTFDRRVMVWNPHGESYTGPTSNFSKLIVWCFIAGFFERFLPDHLSALETKSKAA